MKTGKVKFFNQVKGFGFITVEESGEEVFVHVTGLKDEIRQDDSVTFDLEEDKKEEMYAKLQTKLWKSKEELQTAIAAL
jgi:CspA family cold shock protein